MLREPLIFVPASYLCSFQNIHLHFLLIFMKLNHSVLFLTLVLVTSLFSCQKETITPSSEEYVVYESLVPADRAANTATVSWSTTDFVDARFEVVDPTSGAVLYSYGWIYFKSGTNTANYTVTTGNSVLLRVKARKAVGAANSSLYASFTSSCALAGCACVSFNVTAAPGTPWAAANSGAFTSGACL